MQPGCPEQAIIFPDYKTPAIAGAPVGNIGGLKIDLTKLFGGGDALTMAAQNATVNSWPTAERRWG